MSNLPVSCLITSYNNLKTLTRAIESVLNQTEKFSEIIIADDCSSDGSRELIQYYADRYLHIKPLFNDSNLGPSGNRDNAIKNSRFPFFTQLDGDDYFCRHKLKNEWAVLGEDENNIAFSRVLLISENNPYKISVRNPAVKSFFKTNKYFEFLLSRLVHEPRDMLISKKLYYQVGGYNRDLRVYEDWDLKLRLAGSSAKWCYSGSFGTVYMQHGAGLSKLSRIQDIQDIIAMNADLIEHQTGKSHKYFQELYEHPRSSYESRFLRSSLFDKFWALWPILNHFATGTIK